MEIILFNDKGPAKLWYYQDVNVPFVDKTGTAFRQATWKMRIEQCQRLAMSYGRWQLVISVRSKMRPSEIDDDEFKAWNKMVTKKLKTNNQKAAI